VKRLIRKFVRQFRYGEKGFTLIELLVVIAILGVLAAVVVPNVSKFMGKGKDEAGLTELHSVQTAVTAMMADTGNVTCTEVATPVQDMTSFPSGGAGALFGDLSAGGTHYLQKNQTEFWYTCEIDGTIRGWWRETGGSGYEIGVNPAP